MFVIRYSDGAYERVSGFPVDLLEATHFVTRDEAENQLANLAFDAEVIELPDALLSQSMHVEAFLALARHITDGDVAECNVKAALQHANAVKVLMQNAGFQNGK